MKSLKESFIKAKDLDKIVTRISKQYLEPGDIILTKNDLYMVLMTKDELELFYKGNPNRWSPYLEKEKYIFVIPMKYSYTFIEYSKYDDNLKRKDFQDNNVIKIFKNAIDLDVNSWKDIVEQYEDFVKNIKNK